MVNLRFLWVAGPPLTRLAPTTRTWSSICGWVISSFGRSLGIDRRLDGCSTHSVIPRPMQPFSLISVSSISYSPGSMMPIDNKWARIKCCTSCGRPSPRMQTQRRDRFWHMSPQISTVRCQACSMTGECGRMIQWLISVITSTITWTSTVRPWLKRPKTSQWTNAINRMCSCSMATTSGTSKLNPTSVTLTSW